MKYKYNIFADELDLVGQTDSDITDNDARYLKLDQTPPQTVSDGLPTFGSGIKIRSGYKLIYDA